MLLFGLVLMHHAPSHGGHDSDSVSAAAAGPALAMIDHSVPHCPCPATNHDAPHPGGGAPVTDTLLHLCLAVLAAIGGLLSAGWLLRGSSSQAGGNPGSAGPRIGLEYLRPPVPVARRLAALCVLRL